MSSPRSIGIIAAALLLAFIFYHFHQRSRLSLPPGPQGAFFTGVASLLSRIEPWKQYAAWSRTYGDVISFRVYNRRLVVLNTRKAVHDLLNKRAILYSDRPKLWMVHDLCGRGRTVFNISGTDERHRRYRKVLHNGLSPRATQEYAGILEEETKVLIQGIEEAPQRLEGHYQSRHAVAIIMKVAFGYSVTQQDDFFLQAAEESSKITGWASAPGRWLVDHGFPFLRFVPSWIPGADFKRQTAMWRHRLEALTELPHEWVKKQMASGHFTESFSSRQLRTESGTPVSTEDEDIVKWCAAALYAGAADTTVSALISFIMLMALHPRIQRRAQEEIDRILGRDHAPTFADVERLEYLKCILKELLRYAPVGPLALPHRVIQDDEYSGYLIPKDATVIANVWSIMHDPQTYPDPFVFDPDRFFTVGSEAREEEVAGESRAEEKIQLDPRELAFGFGRRVCPGSSFAEVSMLVAMANILAHFDISPKSDAVAASQRKIEFTTGITRFHSLHLEVTSSPPPPLPLPLRPAAWPSVRLSLPHNFVITRTTSKSSTSIFNPARAVWSSADEIAVVGAKGSAENVFPEGP
ncbi:hypothetical protein EW146_g6645 [Bondarzewia mesenterica]|uniref:Cytochrome P450 n=1 Tax=Bondarzewia mesenterica TaxID=1095465 RepID=A0A4S4LMY5_9AGAM|nr:hypothetical protein EW146_g6645 [Bondarzewia mesenterica]